METHIKLIRSKRKTLAIEIRPDGRVFIRAPLKMKQSVIDAFVKQKSDWIEKHIARIETQQNENKETLPFSYEETELYKKRAYELILPKAERFAEALGVSYGKITVRRQKTLWGSCTREGNLSFNCLLCLVPEQVLDYVVIHELCHRVNMDHSKVFWANVERMCPDYKTHRQWLKLNGRELIKRLR